MTRDPVSRPASYDPALKQRVGSRMSEPKATAESAEQVVPGVWCWHVWDERIDFESDVYAVAADNDIVLTELIQFFMDTSYATKPKVLFLKTDTSEHGEFKYLRFDIQTSSKIRSCVGFLRLSAGNKKFTYGHYCLPNEGEITFKTISQIIDSVTIHGTASEPEGG